MSKSKPTRERPQLRLMQRMIINRIEKKRYRMGWSQQRLANESNMYRSVLVPLLKGDNDIKLVEFVAICQSMGLHPAPLLQECLPKPSVPGPDEEAEA